MSILNNAVDTIQIGLEDYKNDDPKRRLSAVRNISSGILLLFKEKLRQLSPKNSDEVLIKRDIRPSVNSDNNEIVFKGKGSSTVDVRQIRERFDSLGITVNWKTVEVIIGLRNNIEHYYTDESDSVIIEIISKSFIVIRDFCVEHLNTDPISLLGQDAWNIFLEADEIYRKEKDICTQSLSQIDWTYPILMEGLKEIRCPNCQSDLIMACQNNKYTPAKNMHLVCKKCQNEFDFEEVIEQCLHEALWADAFISIKDGGESPYDICPNCSKETYYFYEEGCLACGYKQTEKRCAVCHTELDLEESYEGNLCSYHRWQAERDD